MTQVSYYTRKRKGNNLPESINPEIDAIISHYCGISLSEIMAGKEDSFETGSLWSESDAGATATGFEKALVEMLHLAFMRGGEY
ncbi:MAG: hypothetical protein JW931_00705 [Methanomicrobiaceae archaeon]|nr:hypothetical protein [Methanomicrobiaceae archaeon]